MDGDYHIITKIEGCHVVRPGDNLSKIALKYYGDPSRSRWRIIYESNKSTIGTNPNVIRPGQTLRLP